MTTTDSFLPPYNGHYFHNIYLCTYEVFNRGVKIFNEILDLNMRVERKECKESFGDFMFLSECRNLWEVIFRNIVFS